MSKDGGIPEHDFDVAGAKRGADRTLPPVPDQPFGIIKSPYGAVVKGKEPPPEYLFINPPPKFEKLRNPYIGKDGKPYDTAQALEEANRAWFERLSPSPKPKPPDERPIIKLKENLEKIGVDKPGLKVNIGPRFPAPEPTRATFEPLKKPTTLRE